MAWPMGSDYASMLQNSAVAFKDPELKRSTIKRDKNGLPHGMSGQFAVVYKATLPSGSHRAVRAFTSGRDGRGDTYRAISEYLARHRHLNSLVEFTYAEKGIRGSDGKFYPLVTMEWVEGATLFDWLKHQCQDNNAARIGSLVPLWSDLVDELADAQIAHGDLQQANVMVDASGRLKLVDYDCMCVPELVGRPNLETGVEPYQHPQRNAETLLSPHLDNFSALFIYIGLRALAARPRLWADFIERHQYDKLLIRKEDFQDPAASELFRTLRQSPDSEVGRLVGSLIELHRTDIHKVPALRDILFSFDRVGSLLSQGMFDEAVELVSRRNSRQPEPAPLVQPLADARRRVDCLRQLRTKLQAGDDAGALALANSPLLRNYPAAQPHVEEAQAAAAAAAWFAQLQTARQAQAGRELVKLWDAGSKTLKQRPAAMAWAGEVEGWRKRNAAWDRVIVEYRKSPPDPSVLRRCWGELLQLGGHPEAAPNKDRIELAIDRYEAWSKVPPATTPPSQTADEQLMAAWREDLFAKWPIAEPERPRRDAAEKRLKLLAQLQQAIAAVGAEVKLEGERRIVALGAGLQAAVAASIAKSAANNLAGSNLAASPLVSGSAPAAKTAITYEHSQSQRVRAAQSRLVAFERFVIALREAATETSIIDAWMELQRAQGAMLAETAQQQRVALAQQRIPLLQKLQKVPLEQPPEQLDVQLLAVWHKTLDDCPEAAPWAQAQALAARRRELLHRIQSARERGDEAQLAEFARDPVLQGYALPRDISQAAAAAIDRLARGTRLVESLRTGDRAAFLEQFDAPLLRQSPAQFAPLRDALRALIVDEVLPAKRLQLEPPIAVSPLARQGSVLVARWRWPTPRFTDQCLLGIVRNPPRKTDDPRTMPMMEQTIVTRKSYESASGSRRIHPLPEWEGCYVVVWAIIEAGFETFHSEPLTLGRISSQSPSASGRGAAPRFGRF